MSRDDFTALTKRKLEERVSSRCSWQGCGKATRGAARGDEAASVNLGVAAHITAAAAGGPRFDATLSPEERKSLRNGIWLCQNHARLIDADESAYSVAKLHEWKRHAEERSALSVEDGRQLDPIPLQEDVADLRHRLMEMARNDLIALRRGVGWPRHAVALSLRLALNRESHAFDPEQLAQKLVAFTDFSLVAPPGTGKSTTLVQLAEAVAVDDKAVPLVVLLPEWAASNLSILSAVRRHSAFANATDDDIGSLAREGMLVLFLDGWNELTESARQRARVDLRTLRRDFPDLSIVIASRQQGVALPLDEAWQIEIEPLDDARQNAIARAMRGDEGLQLLQQARSVRGVRELTRIPLFLNALLSLDSTSVTPRTKEAVLAAFVGTEESRAHARGEALCRATLGFHRDALRAIALAGVAAGSAAISEVTARPAVRDIFAELVHSGQLAMQIQPGPIIDALVAEHLLIRNADGLLTFQHQQFQEWFASFEVEKLAVASASGDTNATEILRIEVLDKRPWEESILFACQRMDATVDGPAAVAHAITLALGIDPMLAADMIAVAPNAWEIVSSEVQNFVAAWHIEGTVDRAVAFMNSTGRQEFRAVLEPLFMATNSQIHLAAFRAGRRFPISLFGPDPTEYLLSIPEEPRSELLLELIERGEDHSVEISVDVAIRSESVRLQAMVASELYDRDEDAALARLLARSDDEVLASLAGSSHFDPVLPSDLDERWRIFRTRYMEERANPYQRLNLLLQIDPRPEDFDERLETLLSDAAFPAGEDHLRDSVCRASVERPAVVAQAMLRRAVAGASLPYGAAGMARDAGMVTDEQAIGDLLYYRNDRFNEVEFAAAVAGPVIVGNLLNAYLAAHQRIRGVDGRILQDHSDEFNRLRQILRASPLSARMAALVARPIDCDIATVELLANLLSGDNGERQAPFEPQLQEQCDRVLRAWSNTATAVYDERTAGAAVASAIGAVGSRALVGDLVRLLDHDLAGRERERSRGDTRRAMWSFEPQYYRAFTALAGDQVAEAMMMRLDDERFSFDAARILLSLYRQAVEPDAGPTLWLDSSFLGAVARRGRVGFAASAPIHPHGVAILSAADRFTELGNFDLARQLTAIAVRFPIGDPTQRIAQSLQPPGSRDSRMLLVRHEILAGGVADAAVIMGAIADLRTAAVANPWLLDGEHSELHDWIELIPFSTEPHAILAEFERFPANRRAPHFHRNLLRALSVAGGAENEGVLFSLANAEVAFLANYEWWQCVLKLNSESAAVRVLQMLDALQITEEMLRQLGDARSVRELLAGNVRRSDQFRSQVYDSLNRHENAYVGELLASVIAEVPDAKGIELLVRHRARTATDLSGALYTALKTMAVGEEPSVDWPGSFRIFGVAVPEVRRSLYAMTQSSGSAEATLARQCLITVDELRDEWGTVDGEPRHPNIAAGGAWPQVSLVQ